MNNSKIPLPSEGASGPGPDGRATATCFCGAVQISFPTEVPGLVDAFICDCADDRKITASMFASNFIIKASEVEHVRGQDKLTKFAQSKTIATGNTMENDFCSVCGTLMYRISSGHPDQWILRIGTVDDFTLHETRLKPRIETFAKDRVAWFKGGVGIEPQMGGEYFAQ